MKRDVNSYLKKAVLDPTQREKITSRSLRSGSAMELMSSDHVSMDATFARGGWATGNTWDTYVFVRLSLIMKPMLVLAGVPMPRDFIFPPRLECVTDKRDKQQIFVSLLFSIDITEFLPGGELERLPSQLAAVLLRHFESLYSERKFENQVIVSMMRVGAEAQVGRNQSEILEQLQKWSREIECDFQKRNQRPSVKNDDQQL